MLALGLGNGVVKVWEARAGAARGPTDFGRVDTAQVLKNHKAAVSQVTHSTSIVLVFARSKRISLGGWNSGSTRLCRFCIPACHC